MGGCARLDERGKIVEGQFVAGREDLRSDEIVQWIEDGEYNTTLPTIRSQVKSVALPAANEK